MRWLWMWMLAGGLLFAAEEMEVTGSVVNIRKAPAPNAAKAGKLKKGDRVQVKAIKNEWAELDNGKGFVKATLLSKPGKAPEKSVVPADKKPAADNKPTAGKKTAAPVKTAAAGKTDNPFADIPVVAGSGREVTVKGMLFPIKGRGPIAYALLKPVGNEYQPLCYVYVYKKEAPKFPAFANKEVQLVGTWYKVKDWKKPVMQVRSIKGL